MPSKQWDTGQFNANGQWKTIDWNNDFGHFIAIKKAYIWMGLAYGLAADMHAEMRRKSDNAIIAMIQVDRYTQPGNSNKIIFDHSEPGLTVDRNDGIIMKYFANAWQVSAPNPYLSHANFIIWYPMDNGYI